MQTFFIYPPALANHSKFVLQKIGWPTKDIDNIQAYAPILETKLNQIRGTLIKCGYTLQPDTVIWDIKLSAPGQCDIFQLIQAIRETFDLNGVNETFNHIDVQGTFITISFQVDLP